MYSSEAMVGFLRVSFSEIEEFRHDKVAILFFLHSVIHNIFVKNCQWVLGIGDMIVNKNSFSHASYMLVGKLSINKYIVSGYE